MQEDVKRKLFTEARKLRGKILKDSKQSLLNSYDLGVIYHKLELGGVSQKEIAQNTLQKSQALLRAYLKLARGMTRAQLAACFDRAEKYGNILSFHTAVQLVYALDKINDKAPPDKRAKPLEALKMAHEAFGYIAGSTLQRVGRAALVVVNTPRPGTRIKTKITSDAAKMRRMLGEVRRIRSQIAKLSRDKDFAMTILHGRNIPLSVRADAEAFLEVMSEIKGLVTITSNRRSRAA